ncbi:MAG TPA: methyltransferase domain-containing protein [Bryobacteraceae bacterium]|nr:methyltransferase domain-containing protein [Bryobacteraceae bacterium]
MSDGSLAVTEVRGDLRADRQQLPVLDVGCGINKYPGAIGLDRNPHTAADVVADLNHFPFPFADTSFREIRAIHVIEHVADVIGFMEEVHRLLAPGGGAVIVTIPISALFAILLIVGT